MELAKTVLKILDYAFNTGLMMDGDSPVVDVKCKCDVFTDCPELINEGIECDYCNGLGHAEVLLDETTEYVEWLNR